MSSQSNHPTEVIPSPSADDSAGASFSKENIRKTFTYQLEWPSELEVEKPVYRQSSQTMTIAWPGIIAGSAIYGLCIFVATWFLRASLVPLPNQVGPAVAISFIVASFYVVCQIGLTACTLVFLHFLFVMLERFLAGLISARRAVLLDGAIALIPVSLVHAFWWGDVIGWPAFVIFLTAGIWIGAYSAASSAARYGKFTYTQRRPSASEQLQFRLGHLFALTAIVAIVITIDQSFPGLRLGLIAGTILGGLFLLILFDRRWMRFHGEF